MWQRSSYLTKELCLGKEFGCLPLCIGGFSGPLCNPSRPFAELGQGKATSTGKQPLWFLHENIKERHCMADVKHDDLQKKKKKKEEEKLRST